MRFRCAKAPTGYGHGTSFVLTLAPCSLPSDWTTKDQHDSALWMYRLAKLCPASPRSPCQLVVRSIAASDRVAPHDQRIFTIVGVVAASDSARLETCLLVELDRHFIRHPDLQRVAATGFFAGQLEEPLEQSACDPLAPVAGRNGKVHDMPRVDVTGDDQVAEQLARLRLKGAERDRGRLGQLAGEHRPRPGSRVRVAFDRFDRVEVAQFEATEIHPIRGRAHLLVLSASGTLRYIGSTASAGAKSRASCAWKRARGRWRSSWSGGTSAPAASSTERYRTAPLPTQSVPGAGWTASGVRTWGSSWSRKTSPRLASTTGRAPGAPAASASSVDTPATGTPRASASPRAVASPMRTPVKLPGPIPTAIPSSSRV